MDDTGTLYVADTGNSTIRKITAGAVVTTIAGCPGCIGSANWGRFNTPQGIAVNARGDLYVADTRNNTIQTTAPMPSSLVVDFGPPYGIWIRRGDDVEPVAPVYGGGDRYAYAMSDQDALIIDFGPGVGVWFWAKEGDGDEFWFQLHTAQSDGDGGRRFRRRRRGRVGGVRLPGPGCVAV